ncbi:hypothetical protein F0562_005445 [Nyssa sinensis]|uniref:protein-disulfide reductase n=1 Tax=Nyssa sinensis TaxID=561372 RepID=A0A5J5ANH3_9ASTE|nr:hypothetical protein F0562_005445 [Nyssa sinensis]
MAASEAAEATKGKFYDLNSLLTHSGRDFLVRNNVLQVKFDKLRGKKLGLYFSGSWCGPCQQFTPELIEVYNELSSKSDFEIILISADEYVESFNNYFSKMPWLAVPFSDSETRNRLNKLFEVDGIPHLVILDEKGKVLSDEGVEIVLNYGAEGHPFTPERMKELTEREEAAKKEQSLRSLLVSASRDFVLTNDGKNVPVSELEGKMVGLYFFHPVDDSCIKFTPKLMEVYNKLKKIGKHFEIVTVFLNDDDEESFKQSFGSMPWFALPFKDKICYKLVHYFYLQSIPALIIIGPDGKTLHSNAVEAIEEDGIQALTSFTSEKSKDFAELEKAREEEQTLESILVLGDKDYVIGKDGVKVPVSNLVGRNILLYFSDHWCPAHHDFLPNLIEAYHNIKAKDDLFENHVRRRLPQYQWQKMELRRKPMGILVTFSHSSLTQGRNFLLRNNVEEVPISELEGKMVGLYFFSPSFDTCLEFTPKLVELYGKLKEVGERFEIVMVYLDDNEELFKQSFRSVPWLTLPFKDESCLELLLYFELESLPTLAIIGPDGKTLHSNAAEAIEELGIQAYPFTPEIFAKLAEIERAKQEAQTLESILVSGNRDFVIGKDGAKVPVSNLVGKNILLYFSAHWCPFCHIFLPKLIEAYHKIKAKDDLFEVIFISSDRDQASFDEFFSRMPWLALPFGDVRNGYLSRKFKVDGIPAVVAIGPTGRTVTTEAAGLIRVHGADAYPFTDKCLEEIKAELEEMVKRWPEKVKHALHKEHQLVLSQRSHFWCDGCSEEGYNWSFHCEECDFDLHPKCALEEDKESMVKKLLKKAQSLIEKFISFLQKFVSLIFKL